MGHLSLKHFAPLRNNFMPSRRHRRQTASVYLAKFLLLIDDRFTGLASPFVPDKNQWPVISCQRPVNSISTCWPLVTDHWPLALHSAAFRRTASVVRNRGNVTNRAHFNPGGSQSAHGRLAARSRTADANVDAADSMIARHVCGIRRSLLRGKGSALARTPETQRSRTLPRQNVAIHVGNGHDRVVEGRLHIRQTVRHMFALLLFEGFLLAFFLRCGSGAARCCWFRHISS